MNLGNHQYIDLNLLVVFEALIKDRSVSRAATRVRLSQSAMSHALQRLRVALDDPLFVREVDGMRPTPRAMALAEALGARIDDLRRILQPPTFAAATSAIHVSVAMDNFAAVDIGTKMVQHLMRVAPYVSTTIRLTDNLDLAEALGRGDIDIAITTVVQPQSSRLLSAGLLQDRWVAVRRLDDPQIEHAFSAETYSSLRHVALFSNRPNDASIDSWLAAHGLVRSIVNYVNVTMLPAITAETDMVVTLPSRTAALMKLMCPVSVYELPSDAPIVQTSMYWHPRLDDHPAHKWIRKVLMLLSEQA